MHQPDFYTVHEVKYINNSDYDIIIVSTQKGDYTHSSYETPILIKKNGGMFLYTSKYSNVETLSFEHILAPEAILEYASSDGNKVKVKHLISEDIPNNFCYFLSYIPNYYCPK